MAIVCRSKRILGVSEKVNPIGPGEYYPPLNINQDLKKNLKPFNSSSQRKAGSLHKDSYPGPGTYNISKNEKNKNENGNILNSKNSDNYFDAKIMNTNPKENSVFKSNTIRFNIKINQINPSPCDYFQKDNRNFSLDKYKGYKNFKHPNKKLLEDIKIENKYISIPSIPSLHFSLGYEVKGNF